MSMSLYRILAAEHFQDVTATILGLEFLMVSLLRERDAQLIWSALNNEKT